MRAVKTTSSESRKSHWKDVAWDRVVAPLQRGYGIKARARRKTRGTSLLLLC